MTKEFIPYEQALALKELGFDEPCIGYYNSGVKNPLEVKYSIPYDHKEYLSAPLYQQAFKWFREKYKLHHKIEPTIKNKYASYISQIGWDYIDVYKHYEEAELACLIKLIEIVKNK